MKTRLLPLVLMIAGSLSGCPLTTVATMTVYNLSVDREIVEVRVSGPHDIGFGENWLEDEARLAPGDTLDIELPVATGTVQVQIHHTAAGTPEPTALEATISLTTVHAGDHYDWYWEP